MPSGLSLELEVEVEVEVEVGVQPEVGRVFLKLDRAQEPQGSVGLRAALELEVYFLLQLSLVGGSDL